jgi:hypothetical protein
MMPEEKIEDLGPHYKTVLQALRYGLEILDNPSVSDKDKVSRARHQIRDAMHILGYTDHLVETYRKP